MSEAHMRAQQARRERERAQAKESANIAAGAAADAAAAAIPDDAPIDPQPDPEAQQPEKKQRGSASDWRMQALEELRGRPEDDDEVERQLSDFTQEQEPTPAQETPAEETQVSRGTPAAQPAAETVAAAPMVKVHVNGQEIEVAQSEIDDAGGMRAYQRQKGLEHQIEVAKENNKRTYEMMQQMARIIQGTQSPNAAPQQPKSVLELAKEKVQALQFGTTDEAAAAWADVITAAVPKIDQEQLIRIAAQESIRLQAVEEFVAQNQDIDKNPYLSTLYMKTVESKLAQGFPSNWRKFYADTAQEIRNGLGLPNPTAPAATTPSSPNPTGSMADKDARKASIVALPVAGSRMPAPEEPKPLTREDKISLLRKTRGQQT